MTTNRIDDNESQRETEGNRKVKSFEDRVRDVKRENGWENVDFSNRAITPAWKKYIEGKR